MFSSEDSDFSPELQNPLPAQLGCKWGGGKSLYLGCLPHLSPLPSSHAVTEYTLIYLSVCFYVGASQVVLSGKEPDCQCSAFM